MKVLLVSMPFGALERQALGLSLLKARLTQTGTACDVRYLTFPFAETIGHDEYQWATYHLPHTAFAGEWCFSHLLYGKHPVDEQRYVDEILIGTWRISPDDVRRILRIRARAGDFLNHCLAAVPWKDYKVVGFTSTFEQNLASLALAKALKSRFPWLRICFGGANWEGEMGLELHRKFPFIDFVCSGESEVSFPALIDQLKRKRVVDLQDTPIPGVVFRRRGKSICTATGCPIECMDELPYPDFSDYFRDLSQSTVGSQVVPTLLFETSRGCWWGSKSHCTFCGLNGGSMGFRSKSGSRAFEELVHLVDRWKIEIVEAVDNILDMSYFKDFLPRVASSRLSVQLFYEVKSNLSRRHVRALAAAGVTRIQPGIESLSSHVLKLMRKGTTGLQNIQLLKWCKEYQITAEWNLLYGFPGETREDYEAIEKLMGAIRFLNAPSACGPVRLDRFSPYFADPERFGMTNVRPMASYSHIYPFDDGSMRKVAYYFDYDYAPDSDPRGHAAEAVAYAENWRQQPETGMLWSVLSPDGSIVVMDTRTSSVRPQVALSGLERVAYEFCDETHSAARVARELRIEFPEERFSDEQVKDFLESMVANRFMVTDGINYLSLAIPTYAIEKVLELRKGAFPPAVVHQAVPELQVL
ncbi:MAG: hypothetical protein QOJ42_454 [Acidobacteriaceae bacterium]|jgi:ribosomal peptide maturation radical SAM protein 1|nr:hypothetical protein [Acidobacteriaceae bacterium]MDX6464641.1 hypothetical protein [Acidobacteriaceae bacterium]